MPMTSSVVWGSESKFFFPGGAEVLGRRAEELHLAVAVAPRLAVEGAALGRGARAAARRGEARRQGAPRGLGAHPGLHLAGPGAHDGLRGRLHRRAPLAAGRQDGVRDAPRRQEPRLLGRQGPLGVVAGHPGARRRADAPPGVGREPPDPLGVGAAVLHPRLVPRRVAARHRVALRVGVAVEGGRVGRVAEERVAAAERAHGGVVPAGAQVLEPSLGRGELGVVAVVGPLEPVAVAGQRLRGQLLLAPRGVGEAGGHGAALQGPSGDRRASLRSVFGCQGAEGKPPLLLLVGNVVEDVARAAAEGAAQAI